MRMMLLAAVLLGSVSVRQANSKPLKAPYTHPVCDVNWAPISDTVRTPQITETPIGNSGEMLYHGRILMHTPEENQTECSVRQFRLLVPMLENFDGSDPKSPVPTIQITFETKDSVGAGDSLLLFGILRYSGTPELATFLIDAQTPGGYQSQDAWYADVTIIGKPKPLPSK